MSLKPIITKQILYFLEEKGSLVWEGEIEQVMRERFGTKGDTVARLLRNLKKNGLVEKIKAKLVDGRIEKTEVGGNVMYKLKEKPIYLKPAFPRVEKLDSSFIKRMEQEKLFTPELAGGFGDE